ncbi:YhcN/YlaJ family sporulation lipoprotein [Mesobacillus foraminis]|uniref:YhcN/YlaJ family sporulation lipoprotein n=1 Tax=Mesobacillus foraminis TaxID=279826 RepID=A0A4R2BFJ0_9BACI|nr:YhcN/YlaJ family sporulation lipoprotein [Mesobacillus foraminis]TCN25757.1 YhcN/YlaJ family sporulation lipoprotein [Mesobacillus foraminis]
MKSIAAIFILILLASGCGTREDASQNRQDDLVKVKNSAFEHVDREESENISNHLAELAERVPQVENATAVVIGNLAVVGIDIKANLERSEVGTIKYAVAESMKDDPYGAEAIVVADPDITARLDEIAEDFNNGRPLQGIMNELADITGRIMPEVPADIIEPNPKNATEQNKEQLETDEKRNLEQKQDKQSNYHKDKE